MASHAQNTNTVRLWTKNFVLVCVLNFLTFSGMWMLPAMLPVFIQNLGASEYMLGWIAGLTSLATIITRPLAGLAVTRFGRRGIFTAGSIGMVLTCLAFAFIPLLGAVFAVRFIQGLSWGFMNTACATSASDIIPKLRFAEGMGYFGLASSVAMIASPALSLTLFYTWGSTAAALVCAGFFMLALLCSCFVLYLKLPPYKKDTRSPRQSLGAFVSEKLFERRALAAALLMMLTASSYGIVQSFLPAMEEARGIAEASLFFVAMAVAAIVARPTFGRWADKHGTFAPALTAFFAMAVSMLILAWAYSPVPLIFAAFLQGIGYSASFSLFLALATVKAESANRGSAIATVMVGFDIGAGLSAVVLGFFISSLGFEAAFIGGAGIAFLGVLLTTCLRKRLGRT